MLICSIMGGDNSHLMVKLLSDWFVHYKVNKNLVFTSND